MSDALKNWRWEGKQRPGRSQAFSPIPKDAIRKRCKHRGRPVSLSRREKDGMIINKYVVERWERNRSRERLDWRCDGPDAQHIKMRPKSLQKYHWVSLMLSNYSWGWGLTWRGLSTVTWVCLFVSSFLLFQSRNILIFNGNVFTYMTPFL